MRDLRHRIRADWTESLKGILAGARQQGKSAVLSFDLDSTLFSNLPRQARIVREFGAAHGQPALTLCAPRHFSDGWNMRSAMRNCGMNESDIEASFSALRAFWIERFFTSEYCVDDVAIDGAAAFTQEVVKSGATLAYVTGRPERMREGTVAALGRSGFPVPSSEGPVRLIMKPAFEMNDDEFKRTAHAQLKALGQVIAAFDNEPTHANDYRRVFPEATVIHLATDHSDRPVDLLEGVISVPHFSHGT